jgi:signal transduction histidine kinase
MLARAYKGVGLGLAPVKTRVEVHGGRIEVASTLGQGSRFTVVLPWPAGQAR